MEIRAYYQKVREIEQTITGDFAIVVSLNTGDGGVEGRKMEVTRSGAARLVADGAARLATPEEAQDYRREQELAREEAERKAEASRVQVSIVSNSEPRPYRPGKKN